MKALLYSPFVFLLTGCLTNPITGRKKLLGILPVPFTGDGGESVDPAAAMAIDQLTPLIWSGMILIIGGGFMWYLTSGKTGMGKFSILLGVGLILAAVFLPQIPWWAGLIAVCGVGGYFVWDKISEKKQFDGELAP